MISHQNYPSWSGAENRDKDQYTPIECSNTLLEQSRLHKNVFLKVALKKMKKVACRGFHFYHYAVNQIYVHCTII